MIVIDAVTESQSSNLRTVVLLKTFCMPIGNMVFCTCDKIQPLASLHGKSRSLSVSLDTIKKIFVEIYMELETGFSYQICDIGVN